MDQLRNLCTSDVIFSLRQSNNGVCVVWKIQDFSTLKESPECYESPEWTFKDVKWCLELYPFGYTEENFGNVSLYLTPRVCAPLKVKYELFVKSDSAKDFYIGVTEANFSDGYGDGNDKLFNRQDLLDGKLGNLLPNDVLTICCRMEIAEELETETATVTDAKKVQNCEKDSFLSKFREPLESGRLSDVLIRVGEETIPAHKLILSVHSEVFKAMFDNDMKESQENTVDLVDMDLTVARAMLLWMYTREVQELSPDKTLQLYVAADKFLLTELKEKCRDGVSEHMSSETVGDVFEVAKLHSDAVLAEAAKHFFADNVKSILKSEEWKEFSSQKLALSVELLSYTITSNEFIF